MIEFIDWYDAFDPINEKYKKVLKEFQGSNDDDTLFLEFLRQTHPAIRTINIVPNLVDHIDYLIGGSVLFNRKQKINRACYLSETDKIKVNKLADELKKAGIK